MIKLARNFSWSFVNGLVALAVMFFIFRVVINELSTAMIGVWSIVSASVAMGRISDNAFTSANSRGVAQAIALDEPGDIAVSIIQNIFATFLATTFLVILIAPLILYSAFEMLLKTIELNDLLLLFACSVGSSIVGSVSLVLVSTFDGMQITRVRAKISIFAILLNGLSIFYLTKHIGILAFPVGQLIQFCTIIILSTVYLYPQIKGYFLSSFTWRGARERLKFSGGLQLVSVFQQLFEYSVKFFMLRIGGADIVGLFEIAYRGIIGVRGVIAGGLSVLIPFAAHNKSSEAEIHMDACLLSTVITSVIAILGSVVLVGFSKEILSLLNVDDVKTLQWLFAWTCVAWILSLWSIPLLYTVIGEGKVKIPLFSSILILVIFVCTILLVGSTSGGSSIIIIYTASIWLGSGVIILAIESPAYRRKYFNIILKLFGTSYLAFFIFFTIFLQYPALTIIDRAVGVAILCFGLLAINYILFKKELYSLIPSS